MPVRYLAPDGLEARRRNLGELEHVTPMTGRRHSAHSEKVGMLQPEPEQKRLQNT